MNSKRGVKVKVHQDHISWGLLKLVNSMRPVQWMTRKVYQN